jgi:hypothetical protein
VLSVCPAYTKMSDAPDLQLVMSPWEVDIWEIMARMTIELPDEIVETVAQTAETLCVSKVEVLRRLFTILKITQEEKKKGNDLGIVNDDKVIARFIGV